MESRSNIRTLSFLAIAALITFVAIQFARPTLENPPVTAEVQAPAQVRQILKTSCYNCHSNETQLPWFDQVAPAYWLVTHDVKEARHHLNFSEIGKLPAAQQKAALYEAVNMIRLGAMPLSTYTLVHPNARVSPEDVAVLEHYLHPPAQQSMPDDAVKAAADAQYAKFIHTGNTAITPQPSLNGVPYFPDYRNWKVLSTTDRFDNNTLRVIFGNDVAMRAIAERHINPWPDGTVFAKTAWNKQVDANGDTHSGAFYQVEFMVKDSQKYASTQGWGYSRWRGADLKPYGKDAHFASECAGCHNAVRQNDYVYTFPLSGQQ